jgi:acyl-CoA hydrolase
LGAKILGGIAGSYDFSRNGLYSIFVGPSTARGGKISTIVPLVSHVDHTEHDVDILVTEQGLADLRGLDPRERGETIIQQCAHPDFKEMLSEYFAKATKEPGHIPVCLEESRSFHSRLKEKAG